MTFTLSMLFKSDSAAAKADLRTLQGEVAKTGTGAKALDAAAKAGATGVNALGTSADRAAADVQELAVAQTAAARTASTMASTQGMAAGSVGNLVAQFNDVTMMMAAGQNPFMLAIQQGSQISQVIGPMGAAGAVKALGAAFKGMLAPANIAVYAVITALGFATQWLFSTAEEAKSLGDRVDDLSEQIDRYRESAERARGTTADLRQEFGDGAEAARTFYREMAEMERREAERQAKAATFEIQRQIAPDTFLKGSQRNLADFFDLSVFSRDAQRAFNPVIDAFNAIGQANGLDEQIAALETLRARFITAAEASGSMSAAEEAALRQINTLLLEQQRLRASVELDNRQQTEANGRFPTADQYADGAIDQQMRARDAQQASDEMLASLRAEAEMLVLIAQNGRNSQVVAEARAEVERQVFAEMLSQLDATAAAKEEMQRLFDIANQVPVAADKVSEAAQRIVDLLDEAASINLGAVFDSAYGPAARLLGLAGALVSQLSAMAWVETMQPGGTGNLAAQYAQYGAGRTAFNTAAQGELGFSGAPPVPKTDKVGGGAAKAEADAVADLIAKLREEQQVLLETDPVKAEMAKHREVLAQATEAERAEIEELIAAELQLQAVQEASDFFGRESLDFLKGIVRGGEDAKDAVDNLLNSLLDAALQALWLGEGPLAGILGISGSIFDAIIGVPKKAEGGMIYGDGGGTADKVPVMMSPGEFTVNARSTARYRSVLERINAGDDLPGFASGGMIGGAGFANAGGTVASGGPITVNVNVPGARGSAEIEEAVVRGVEGGLQLYRREGLALDVKTVLRQGGRVTG